LCRDDYTEGEIYFHEGFHVIIIKANR
jgi:hypothetical protein